MREKRSQSLTVRLLPSVKQMLKELSIQENCTMAELVEEMIIEKYKATKK
jgi:predicted DNA-binding protein